LRLDIVAGDGDAPAEYRVFCRVQRRGVRVDSCASCVHCDEIRDGDVPSVECTSPVSITPATPIEERPDGEGPEVGSVLEQGTVAVLESTTIARARAVMRAESRRALPIVDENHALVGLVHDTGFLGYHAASRGGPVALVMSNALAIDERTPLRTALRMLAGNHLREATVISRDRVPLGVFRDVDGLRWLARARERSAK